MKEQSELLRRSRVEQSYKPAPGSGGSLWAFPGSWDELWSNSEFLRFQSFLLVDIEFSAKMVNESLGFAGESTRSLKAIKVCISFKRSYFSLVHIRVIYKLFIFYLLKKKCSFAENWHFNEWILVPNNLIDSQFQIILQKYKCEKVESPVVILAGWLMSCSLLVMALSTKKHDIFLYMGKVSWQGNGRKSWT